MNYEIKKLTIRQILEANSLYLHLLNHKEVQEAPTHKGMPCCKICNKSAKEILDERPFMKKMSGLMDQWDETNYNEFQRLSLLVLDRNKQIEEKNNKLMLMESDLDRAIQNKNWFDVKLARSRIK